MALSMKTACCGTSLRTSTLILLYINLIGNIWSILSAVCNYGDPLYKQFMDDNVDFLANIVGVLIESLIFLAAIIAIGKEKKSTSLLTAVVIFLLLEAFCWIYFIMKLNFSETFENSLRIIVEKESKKFTEFEQERYGKVKQTMMDMYPIYKSTLNVVFIAIFIYKIYSALVVHSYKVELKEKLVSDAPATKIAAPPAYDIHFAPPQFPNSDLPSHKAGAV